MAYGICILSVIPARIEPAGTSEMVTQLLFGEYYKVLESRDGWIKISTIVDNYECWINDKQHCRLSDASARALQQNDVVVSTELLHVITDVKRSHSFPLSLGAILPFFKNNEMSFDDQHFSFDGPTASVKLKKKSADILSTAYLLLNAPYLWGGKNPLGIDCSGFTQVVFRANGFILPRDSQQQVELGSPRSFVEEAEPGDLAFFDNEEGRIVHVGIIVDKERIIHSSGCVRIDRYDHYGIFHSDTRKYSHHLRVIKQLL
jgi:cell wall-associated NlpC family hydrolase